MIGVTLESDLFYFSWSRPGSPPSPARHSGHGAAIGGPAGGLGPAAHHGRRRGRGRRGPRSAPSRSSPSTTRSGVLVRRGAHPAHPARRITGAVRGSGRRQPPPPDLSRLRPGGRRRLRGRLRAVSHGGRRHGLRDRRGRGRLLGTLSGLPRPGHAGSRSDAAARRRRPATGAAPRASATRSRGH